MLLQQSIKHVSVVYTCNTYFNALVHVIYSEVSGQCSNTIRTFENVEESSDIHHIWAIYVLITITLLWFLCEYMRIIDTATVSGNVCIIF